MTRLCRLCHLVIPPELERCPTWGCREGVAKATAKAAERGWTFQPERKVA